MKITILDKLPTEEEELILKCDSLDNDLYKLINRLKSGTSKMSVYSDGRIHLINPSDIYYFEAVDQKVFAYGKQTVYEVKARLYELEEELSCRDFLRSSKSTILNINKVKSLSPALGGRFEALLHNGEKVIISRQYVPELKELLGI